MEVKFGGYFWVSVFMLVSSTLSHADVSLERSNFGVSWGIVLVRLGGMQGHQGSWDGDNLNAPFSVCLHMSVRGGRGVYVMSKSF